MNKPVSILLSRISAILISATASAASSGSGSNTDPGSPAPTESGNDPMQASVFIF